jgi:phage protein D
MNLAELSAANGAFLVPAAKITVNGQALLQTLAIGVTSVEVDLKLSAAGRFSFTIAHCFDPEKRAFLTGRGEPVENILKFGARVEVFMGYGQLATLTRLISGSITEISTSFPEGGAPELTIGGSDNLFPLTVGKTSRSKKECTDSLFVQLIAQDHVLRTQITPTAEVHDQIEQNQESDADCIGKLAKRNAFEYFCDPDGTLHFASPQDRQKSIVELNWGEGLFSFRPEAMLADQVTRVEVYGWDKDNKRAFVGVANAGEEPSKEARRETGGEQLRAALNRDVVLTLRQPVFSEAEANQRARAVLDDHAKKYLTGDAECIGLPMIVPDRNVKFGNLGSRFSKTYYVQEAVHKFDGSGYRTRIKVKETSL